MITTHRNTTALVRTIVQVDGLDGHIIEVLPSQDCIKDTRYDDGATRMDDDTVKVYSDGDDKCTLDLLPEEALELALGMLHALVACGRADPLKVGERVMKWLPAQFTSAEVKTFEEK